MPYETRRIRLAFTITSALVLTPAALADAPPRESQGEPARNGAQVFEHVRVVQAPELAKAERQAAPAAGMRAYKDENGRLRERTEADAIAEAAAEKAAARTATPARARRSATTTSESVAAATESPGPVVTEMADGVVKVELDESTHVYSVARVDARGRVVSECVTGDDSATKALSRPAQESLDER